MGRLLSCHYFMNPIVYEPDFLLYSQDTDSKQFDGLLLFLPKCKRP